MTNPFAPFISNYFLQRTDGKIAISLNCWSSSNMYTFIAIVAHYINVHGELGMFSNNIVCLLAQTSL